MRSFASRRMWTLWAGVVGVTLLGAFDAARAGDTSVAVCQPVTKAVAVPVCKPVAKVEPVPVCKPVHALPAAAIPVCKPVAVLPPAAACEPAKFELLEAVHARLHHLLWHHQHGYAYESSPGNAVPAVQPTPAQLPAPRSSAPATPPAPVPATRT